MPTERGCTSALTAANPCSAGTCESCSSDYCNVLGTAQHKCVVCSSVLDGTCISNPSGLQAQQCGAPSMDVAETQCYSRVVSWALVISGISKESVTQLNKTTLWISWFNSRSFQDIFVKLLYLHS